MMMIMVVKIILKLAQKNSVKIQYQWVGKRYVVETKGKGRN